MRYPGGKGGAGTYQKIINLIPPHDTYIEAFVGGGNIFERKKPAKNSLLIDKDIAIAEYWAGKAIDGVNVIHGDAVPILKNYDWQGTEFVYCDPPYVLATRKGGKIYKHEFNDQQHIELATVLLAIPINVRVMLSGYRNEIYDDMLQNWHSVDFQAATRRGSATETLWMNYARPSMLADMTYLGENFRERERIKRKKQRWRARLEKMQPLERAALLEILRTFN